MVTEHSMNACLLFNENPEVLLKWNWNRNWS